jgi:hypothetical protein
MRSLTLAEARVIGALLASNPGDEADRVQRSGVPRTTFQRIRRRVLIDNWLHERYVPAPQSLGKNFLSFRLVHPFAEHRSNVVSRWRSDPEVVLMWASPAAIFSVAFRSLPEGGGGASIGDLRGDPPEWFRLHWGLTTTAGPSTTPVYFDFEGAWVRRMGIGPPQSYPQGLPIPRAGVPPPSRADLDSILSRPFGERADEGFILKYSAVHLPRRERRLLRDGWIAHRTFPDLAAIPTFEDERDELLVFVSGRFLEGRSLADLYQRLRSDAELSPVLAVANGQEALVGLLSPAPKSLTPRPISVLSIFQQSLRDIQIVREPIATLFPIIDHRYERLLVRG